MKLTKIKTCHYDLTTWQGSPTSKIHKYDVTVAKNYLNENELSSLRRIVSSYLDFAEEQALRNIPMTMKDWEEKLNKFLLLFDRKLLKDAGKISHEIACNKALTEFEKYRIKQDQLYNSDFDIFLSEIKDISVDNNN